MLQANEFFNGSEPIESIAEIIIHIEGLEATFVPSGLLMPKCHTLELGGSLVPQLH